MIANMGYQFDHASKSWMCAFMVAASPQDAVDAEHNTEDPNAAPFYYELLNLDQIKEHEREALQAGNQMNHAIYALAADAIEDVAQGERSNPGDMPPGFRDHLFSVTDDGEKFKVIDPGAEIDWTEFTEAQKTAKVTAEKVPEGTVVETIMADGHVETKKTAGEGGGYRITNPTGEQYLVDTEKFEKLYDATDKEGIYAPKFSPKKVVDIDQNVAFKAPWGEEMRIRKDGVLVHQGVGDIYGIQPDEYKETYSPV